MNEKILFARAMEGRLVQEDGRDLGDKDFHENAFGTTAAIAGQDIEALRNAVSELEAQQAQSIANRNRDSA